jgi:hypothetical protein
VTRVAAKTPTPHRIYNEADFPHRKTSFDAAIALNDVYNGFRGRRRLTEPSWKEFQMLGLERSESLQTLIVEALNDLLVKYGKKPTIAGPSEDEE